MAGNPSIARALSSLAIPIACAGCIAAAPPAAVITELTEHDVPGQPQCRDYTANAIIDGLQQQIVGRFCRRSDGSWEAVETAPGQPTQYVTYWPPYGDAAAYDGWLWGPPFGFSLGAVFFRDRDHHFHRFHHFGHDFLADGMHHDFDHHFAEHHFAAHSFAGHHRG